MAAQEEGQLAGWPAGAGGEGGGGVGFFIPSFNFNYFIVFCHIFFALLSHPAFLPSCRLLQCEVHSFHLHYITLLYVTSLRMVSYTAFSLTVPLLTRLSRFPQDGKCDQSHFSGLNGYFLGFS